MVAARHQGNTYLGLSQPAFSDLLFSVPVMVRPPALMVIGTLGEAVWDFDRRQLVGIEDERCFHATSTEGELHA